MIATATPKVQRMLDLVRRFAVLDTPVLIQGETGTGKELVARALHAGSVRAARPLVTVDCAAVPETLAESELFGHERGAFTGADRPYAGRVESAADGTLFLDEVNSLSLPIQGKLLRFLEEREFWRMGQRRPIRVDVRIISASNAPLEQLVANGQLRADFFYRLDVLRIEVPPLRERLADIPLLVRQFLAEDDAARRLGMTDVSDAVVRELQRWPWPGNVRELRNTVRRAVALADAGPMLDRLADDDVPAWTPTPAHRPESGAGRVPFRTWIRAREAEYLAALVQGHRTIAEQVAASGLPERTLYRKVRTFLDRRAGAATS